jgi:RNA polymerase sigma factor (sigma-70 family)
MRKVEQVSSHAQTRAFEDAFERHVDGVCAFLCRRVGRELGEELTAETFARAFAAWSRYDERRGEVRPWLFGIATNLLRDHLRSEARSLRALARSGCESASADERLDGILVGPEARCLAAALGRLRPGDRDVLLLAAWAELSSQEIAAALEIPAGTARSRLHRARRQVRAALRADSASARLVAPKEVPDG